MADERDFIEKSQAQARLRFGREATSQEMAREFLKYDLDRRVGILDQIDSELATDAPLGLNEARKLLDIRERRRLLGDVHDLARKSGR